MNTSSRNNEQYPLRNVAPAEITLLHLNILVKVGQNCKKRIQIKLLLFIMFEVRFRICYTCMHENKETK